MRAPLANSFGNQVNGFWGAVSGLVGAVVGGVTAVVNGIVGVINSIAGLFTTTRVDMGKVDKARADAENAIVENMSSSLEMLDEIQRFGGAYNGRYNSYRTEYGEQVAETVPLTHALPLEAGTSFVEPVDDDWDNYIDGFLLKNTEGNRQYLARYSGHLVLNEPGLWLIFFRGGVLQGNLFTGRPADLWAYVTPNTGVRANHYPCGQPGFTDEGNALPNYVTSRDRTTGYKTNFPNSEILAFGRATSYVGIENAQTGGGVSLFGAFPAYLPTGGYKVSMAVQSYAKYGGASTSNVFAYKVNTESLRTDIDTLKASIAAALPGDFTALSLTETAISQMVDEAAEVSVEIDYGE